MNPVSIPNKPFGTVACVLVGSLSVTLVAVLGRVVQVQLAPSDQLCEIISPKPIDPANLPLRSTIHDRRNRTLSVNGPSANVEGHR
jgi:hypothetical protein